jgi:tetratricopeptide (TPR) repeat protein
MGNIMYLKDEHDKAIAFYTKTLELNPLHTMALNNRGASHTKQMHAEQALSDFNQTLKIDPDHPLALNNRG